MKNIKVLGSGCANCRKTVELIEQVAAEINCRISIKKIEDMVEIVSYNVMSTPAVLINDVLLHSGGIPEKETIKQWLLASSF